MENQCGVQQVTIISTVLVIKNTNTVLIFRRFGCIHMSQL
ncbi:hypothetical protein PAUR_b0276 [Pseudoalteromonas aurantia 208]|uniref:Orphan protein n=1 Tax=Pseudoalteromonas aurantia 208 TaxID=1314867 RepID=A0ABR9EJ59_9GAMM|nr:hypothetical protein [Pseudoalteromonas aurantia 208]